MFEALAIAATLSSLAAPAGGQAAGFRRDTPQVATDGVKPVGRQGRVSKESLSIAACRTRAARLGEATFKQLRLVDRTTYLVTGTIVQGPDRRRARSVSTYRCTVRGEGEILAFKVAAPAR